MIRAHCFIKAQDWWLLDRTLLAGHWSHLFSMSLVLKLSVIKRLDIWPFQAQNDHSESSQQKLINLINYAKLENMTPQKDMATNAGTHSSRLQ